MEIRWPIEKPYIDLARTNYRASKIKQSKMFSFLAVSQIRVTLGDSIEEIIVRQWGQTNNDDNNNDTHFY